jgi:hypothetical protein
VNTGRAGANCCCDGPPYGALAPCCRLRRKAAASAPKRRSKALHRSRTMPSKAAGEPWTPPPAARTAAPARSRVKLRRAAGLGASGQAARTEGEQVRPRARGESADGRKRSARGRGTQRQVAVRNAVRHSTACAGEAAALGGPSQRRLHSQNPVLRMAMEFGRTFRKTLGEHARSCWFSGVSLGGLLRGGGGGARSTTTGSDTGLVDLGGGLCDGAPRASAPKPRVAACGERRARRTCGQRTTNGRPSGVSVCFHRSLPEAQYSSSSAASATGSSSTPAVCSNSFSKTTFSAGVATLVSDAALAPRQLRIPRRRAQGTHTRPWRPQPRTRASGAVLPQALARLCTRAKQPCATATPPGQRAGAHGSGWRATQWRPR